MRLAWIAIVLAPSLAVAEPISTRCYAGAQTEKSGGVSKVLNVVLERTLDPAASELREHIWSSKAPTKERTLSAKVDVKTNTLEFVDTETGIMGKGTLEGKPWRWTAQTLKFTKGKIEVTVTSKLEKDTTVHSRMDAVADGKTLFTMTGDLSKFDCAKLDEQRAALAK